MIVPRLAVTSSPYISRGRVGASWHLLSTNYIVLRVCHLVSGGGVVGVAHVDAGQEVVLADHLEVVLEGGGAPCSCSSDASCPLHPQPDPGPVPPGRGGGGEGAGAEINFLVNLILFEKRV